MSWFFMVSGFGLCYQRLYRPGEAQQPFAQRLRRRVVAVSPPARIRCRSLQRVRGSGLDVHGVERDGELGATHRLTEAQRGPRKRRMM